ncbi:glycoside hydrolase family 113 [Clostridium cellulovorans]|uniref:Glycosyl hydrolase family 53 n=1 Tax=Clostridium cellulovorans (strain ATCC 35296 / DSM 3052 / OCM 3 / 743B) TaxID=573061 RepID=D9SVP5_CLOC7|nr:glycosyl hydrolase 53 [Clostridium cellulovorans]ADL53106.1 hypothetical protein Clocel_3428 [Clostridium cellulovorans 743B]
MGDNFFVKGMTFGWHSTRGQWKEQYSVDSLKKLKETGSEWIALSFWTWQDTYNSTNIYFDYDYTVTDSDIEYIVKEAHNLGLKVCLKPVVNCKDGMWRGHIDFPDDIGWGTKKDYWKEWFRSYNSFINHYAEIAEKTGCEMFCIGCEMVKTERKSDYWRKLIKDVRELYNGPVIYNANHGKENNVTFWDAVDYIGTSAYFSVADKPKDSVENMVKNWEKELISLKELSEKYNKKILFIEIGCRSAEGCAMTPYEFIRDVPYDEDEQANFYEATFIALENKTWFCGYFWWDWAAKLYDISEAQVEKGFSIYGKKAEKIVTCWYKEKL